MDYKNAAQWLSHQGMSPGGFVSAASVSGPRPGNMMGGFNNVPMGGVSSYPKNEVDLQAIIQQIMQGMQTPRQEQTPALQNYIRNPLPEFAG